MHKGFYIVRWSFVQLAPPDTPSAWHSALAGNSDSPDSVAQPREHNQREHSAGSAKHSSQLKYGSEIVGRCLYNRKETAEL